MLLALCINAIWVLGLSGLLATLSFAHWQASSDLMPWRIVLDRLAMRRALDLSLLLFCFGQLLAAVVLDRSATWLQIAIWTIFTLVFTAKLAFEKANTQ
ncbi:MAG: hypothetical protein R3A44_33470 [Caldilineaceae bacterium]